LEILKVGALVTDSIYHEHFSLLENPYAPTLSVLNIVDAVADVSINDC